MRNEVTEDSVFFNAVPSHQYLCGVTFIWQIAKDFGSGQVLEQGTLYVPDFYLDNFTQALLHDIFTFEEFPSYEEFMEDHSEERLDVLEKLGFPSIKELIADNQRYAATANILFAFQMDETMRMREVQING